MVEIKKYKINNYNCFDISTDEGTFQIWFCGNLDLYWSYKYRGNILDTGNSKDFYITKENYFLYSLFDELYNDVKDYNIFTIDMWICVKFLDTFFGKMCSTVFKFIPIPPFVMGPQQSFIT